MFIAHGDWVRKNARWILGGLLLVLIPSFIALFTTTGGSKRQTTDLPTVQGKPVDATEYEQARNAFMAQYIMNTGTELPRTAEFQDRVTQEAVLRMLLLHKAQEMGIRVTDAEVARHIQGQFVNEARQFDPNRYQNFMIFLNGRGVNQILFENVMRDEMMLMQLQNLITAGVKTTPQEVALSYTPLHEKLSIDLVDFNALSNAVPVTVTDDETRAFFEKNKELYRTPKQVKVRYAYFSIADAKKDVTIADSEAADFYERNKAHYADTNNVPEPLDAVKDKVREDLLQLRAERLAQDRATEFTVKLVPEPGGAKPDFVKLCSAAGITPLETDFFSPTDKPLGTLAGVPFNQTAYSLTSDIPFSDPVPGAEGCYVLEYLASKPSEIPPFDQVKDKVTEEVKQQKAYEVTVKQGQEALVEVQKLVAGGKTFSNACEELKLKIVSPAPFAISDAQISLPGGSRIPQATLGLATNAVSGFIPTEEGGAFFHLKDRQAVDLAEFEKVKADFAKEVNQRDRQALFSSWLSALMRSEQVNFGPARSRPQQPAPSDMPEVEPMQPTTEQPAPAAPATPAPEATPAKS